MFYGPNYLDLFRLASRPAGALVIPLTLVAIWETLSRAGLTDIIYMPAPTSVLVALGAMLASGELLMNGAASLQRMALGLMLALAVALPLGLVVGRSTTLKIWVRPTLEVLRQIPPMALIPLAILWLGIDLAGKAFIVAYACFWPIFYNAALGAEEVPGILLRQARVMELSAMRTTLRVTLPAALPAVFVGIRISVGLSLITLLVAEMVGASDGLGFMVIYAQRNFQTAKMIGVVLAICAERGRPPRRTVRTASSHGADVTTIGSTPRGMAPR
jgi:ABC-type nitrate/sulfonate/bicarbonate transport system permease component